MNLDFWKFWGRMIRLFTIEWLKLKYYKPFWVLFLMYSVAIILICSTGMFFLEWLKSKGADFEGLDPTIIPIYDFSDVWQNMTYMASFFKVVLGFIVIISVSNEDNYRTLRQNIIDGLSKQDFWWSKFSLIMSLSIVATLLILVLALLMGAIYSNIPLKGHFFQSLDFIGAYFLSLITYLTFCFWIALLLPKAGIVIVGIFLYTIIFEPFLALFLENFPRFDPAVKKIPQFFPVRSIYNLIPVPFPKYILRETQNFVGLKETLIAFGWLGINIFLSRIVLNRKDW